MHDPVQMLIQRLAKIPDFRQAGKITYPLVEMTMVTVAGIIADCDNWEDVAAFGRDRLDWLRQFLPFENGVPSHDTFGRVFSIVDPEPLEAAVAGWVQDTFMLPADGKASADLQAPAASSPDAPALQRGHVSFDGKTMCGSHDRIHGGTPLHVVSAYASASGVTLGQTAVAEKSNEITAIPRLVSVLVLAGCVVTIDAMGCQKEIARCLIDAEADYILAVKGNQPTLYTTLIAYFDAMEEHEAAGVKFQHRETVERSRGRIERRLSWTAPAPPGLLASGDWPGLKSIGLVICERTENGRTACESRYYILSTDGNVSEFSDDVRSHWSIENSLHWRLDVTFGEDASRMRRGHTARVFTLLRKLALTFLNQEQSEKRSVRAKRKHAARNPDYLLKVLTSV